MEEVMNDGTLREVEVESSGPRIPPGELPPVEPPSARFIVQLFVVPASIVAAVVGVWLLFGRLAAGSTDIGPVLADLESTNPHRRGRAAFNLTQLLKSDARTGPDGHRLSEDRMVAAKLAGNLAVRLTQPTRDKVELEHRAFLIRALGWFDVTEPVLPILRSAMQIDVEPSGGETDVRALQQEIRQSGIESIARIAGRASERGDVLADAGLAFEIAQAASGPNAEPPIRRLVAFCLGLLPGTVSSGELRSLLLDADFLTRINAAIGLARQGSTDGLDVFREVLDEASRSVDSDVLEAQTVGEPAELEQASPAQRRRIAAAREFERRVRLWNVLKAIGELGPRLSAEQRAEFIRRLRPLAENARIARIRIDVRQTLDALQSAQSD